MMDGRCQMEMRCPFNHPNICPRTGEAKGEVLTTGNGKGVFEVAVNEHSANTTAA